MEPNITRISDLQNNYGLQAVQPFSNDEMSDISPHDIHLRNKPYTDPYLISTIEKELNKIRDSREGIISDTNVTASRFGEPTEIQIPARDLPGNITDDELKTRVLNEYGIYNAGSWIVQKTDGKYIFSKTTAIKDQPPETAKKASDHKPLFAVFSHHNQALDVVDNNRKDKAIIHFDTHSDMMRSPVNSESIADYINTMIADGRCSDVYWVLPDWTKDEKAKDIFWNNNNSRGKELFLDNKTEQTFYVKDGRILFEKPDHLDGSYKIVKFHKITIDDLPSFVGKNDVYLDIDSDYFSNTGFDTLGQINANNNPSEAELTANLRSFTQKLEDKGIKPELMTVARSPNYTSDEDIPVIEDYFTGLYGQSAISEDALDNRKYALNQNIINTQA